MTNVYFRLHKLATTLAILILKSLKKRSKVKKLKNKKIILIANKTSSNRDREYFKKRSAKFSKTNLSLLNNKTNND